MEKKKVEIPKIISVKGFAEKLGLPVTKIIGELLKNGISATINESIDFETAAIVADDFGFEATPEIEEAEKEAGKPLTKEEKAKLEPRPPVVTVMGHVDHGKTKLLDTIRSTNVMEKESGGITQHIGAYQVEVKRPEKKHKTTTVTFLDTPGHEAFSAMRAHGANITDIVVLVVAATEGVKPQTREAVSHAKAAGVPIIVAINKIDLPEANIEKVKRELAEIDLASEDWGGKTIMTPVSAKTGEGIDQLLEMILLVADLAELKANPKNKAKGVVIEAHTQAGMGPVATVLVQDGTLNVGDAIVVGQTFGKIRIMEDFRRKRLKSATPGMPVRIAGLNSVPEAGDRVKEVKDEKEARALVGAKTVVSRHIGIGELSEAIKEGKVKQLKIILKADVKGSLDAILNSLKGLSGEEVVLEVISSGVGPINESDVNMAAASKTLVIGFRVPISAPVHKLAQINKIKISSYDVIYELIEDIEAALTGLLEPEKVEVTTGKLEVLAVFRTTKTQKIIGGKVTDGEIEKSLDVRISRGGEQVGEGKIETLQREKNAVSSVAKGYECGLGINTSSEIAIGDIIESYRIEERVRKLK